MIFEGIQTPSSWVERSTAHQDTVFELLRKHECEQAGTDEDRGISWDELVALVEPGITYASLSLAVEALKQQNLVETNPMTGLIRTINPFRVAKPKEAT